MLGIVASGYWVEAWGITSVFGFLITLTLQKTDANQLLNHETLVADFAVHIVLIQPLDNAAHFGNALLRLFKLLGGCGGLSLAADLVLLDKQLHKAALVLGGVFGHLPEIGEDTGGQQGATFP